MENMFFSSAGIKLSHRYFDDATAAGAQHGAGSPPGRCPGQETLLFSSLRGSLRSIRVPQLPMSK